MVRTVCNRYRGSKRGDGDEIASEGILTNICK